MLTIPTTDDPTMAGLILISRRRFVYDVRFVIVTKALDAEAELENCHVLDTRILD